MRTLSRSLAFLPVLVLVGLFANSFSVHQAHAGAATPPATAVTATPPAASGSGLQNPLNNISSLPDLLNAILKGVVEIGSIFLVFMLVYVGFLFVAAQGNEEKIRGARDALVWTVIGGLILLGAEAISLVIQQTVSTL